MRLLSLVAVGGLLLVLLAGCGDDNGGSADQPEPTAQAQPDEREAGPSATPEAKAERIDFCGSADGKALAAINRRILRTTATTPDGAELERLASRMLALAEDAPAGAGCAVVPLQTLIKTFELAGGSLKGVDAAAQQERLETFARENDLTEARFK